MWTKLGDSLWSVNYQLPWRQGTGVTSCCYLLLLPIQCRSWVDLQSRLPWSPRTIRARSLPHASCLIENKCISWKMICCAGGCRRPTHDILTKTYCWCVGKTSRTISLPLVRTAPVYSIGRKKNPFVLQKSAQSPLAKRDLLAFKCFL